MSQFPHDRFNKNLFELRLSLFGEMSTQRSLDPETTFTLHSAGWSRQKIIFTGGSAKKLQNKKLSLRELDLKLNIVKKN